MKGYTLTELLITIALFATLLTIGVPGLQDLMANNARRAISFDLYSDLQLARSQAIAMNQRVSVCKSADGSSCLAAGTGSWKDGWIIFANPDDLPNPSTVSAVLSVHDRINDARFSIAAIDPEVAARVDFKPNGRSVQPGSLRICHAHASVQGRKVAVLATGAVLIQEDSCS